MTWAIASPSFWLWYCQNKNCLLRKFDMRRTCQIGGYLVQAASRKRSITPALSCFYERYDDERYDDERIKTHTDTLHLTSTLPYTTLYCNILHMTLPHAHYIIIYCNILHMTLPHAHEAAHMSEVEDSECSSSSYIHTYLLVCLFVCACMHACMHACMLLHARGGNWTLWFEFPAHLVWSSTLVNFFNFWESLREWRSYYGFDDIDDVAGHVAPRNRHFLKVHNLIFPKQF